MSWLISKWMALLLLAGGILLAMWIAWRLRRGQRVALSHKLSPRLIRTAALILVYLGIGFGGDDADAQTHGPRGIREPLARNAPELQIDEDLIARWREFQAYSQMSGGFADAKRALSSPERVRAMPVAEYEALVTNLRARQSELGKLICEDVELIREGMSPGSAAPDRLLRILDEMESRRQYDHWLNAWLWRKTQGLSATDHAEELAALYGRIERHARITDALVRAEFEVKPTRHSPRVWMSKGGPPRAIQLAEQQTVATMTAAAQEALTTSSPTTWRRDAVLRVKLTAESGGAVLLRDGQRIAIGPGETFALGRLDLLTAAGEKPLEIRDLEFGALHVPPETVVSVWSLSDYLEISGFKSLQQAAETAAAGDERAARRLELALPLSHKSIRDALRDAPDGQGAPRLRTILALFDDTPELPAKAEAPPQELNALELFIRGR